MKEILVNEEGYKQYFELLDDLERLHMKNALSGSEACQEAVGDGWHDNFAFEEAMRLERDMACKIEKMLNEEKHLKIIKDDSIDEKTVNINDVVRLLFKYSIDDEEEEDIKITGKYMPNNDDEKKEISLNSPLGKAIYKKEIGSTVEYFVNDKVIEVKIVCKSYLIK